MGDKLDKNPYVGPYALKRGDALHGRDREARQLISLLIAERVVLLYSPSGAGKTSLLQALVLPRLEERGFRVWGPIRPGPGAALADEPGGNRYVQQTLAIMNSRLPEREQTAPSELTGLTLGAYLDSHPAPAGYHDLLVFDQFEEVFTRHVADIRARTAYFDQIGAALDDERRWALFSMREEYIANLDPYLALIPTFLRARFRLELLGVDAALECVQAPARAHGKEFTERAARKLVDDLRTIQVQNSEGGVAPTLGPWIEPVQLQVVCRRLWDNLPPEIATIKPEHVHGTGTVDDALKGYYDASLAAIARGEITTERALRRWIDSELIAAQGVRGQVLKGSWRSGPMDDDLLSRLTSTHLVRVEQHGGRQFFELAHDRLVAPIHDSNRQWLYEHTSTLHRRAEEWDSQGRPDSLLLTGQALHQSGYWASAHPDELEAMDRAFLARSRRARARRLILVAIGVAAVAGAVLALWLYQNAAQAREQTQQEARKSESLRLISYSRLHRQKRFPLSLLLGVAALDAAPTAETRSEAGRNLIEALAHQPRLLTRVPPGNDIPLVDTVFVNDRELLTVDPRGTLQRWSLAVEDSGAVHARRVGERRSSGLQGKVTAMAGNRAGTLLALGRITNQQKSKIELWWLDGSSARFVRDFAAYPDTAGGIHAMLFHDDHTLIVAGSTAMVIWDVGDPVHPRLEGQRRELDAMSLGFGVASLASRGHGGQLAVGTARGCVKLYAEPLAPHPGQEVCVPPSPPGGPQNDEPPNPAVQALAYAPDGKRIALASMDTGVYLWDLDSHAPDHRLVRLGEHDSLVDRVVFLSDGQVASGDRDGVLRIWPVAGDGDASETIVGHLGLINAIAVNPGATLMATAGQDGALLLWKADRAQPLGMFQLMHSPEDVTVVALDRTGERLAWGTTKGTITLWNTRTGRSISWLVPDARSSAQSPCGENKITALAFHPMGSQLAAGSTDGRVYRWHLDGSDPPRPLPPLKHGKCGDNVIAMAFHPRGTHLITGGSNGEILTWALNHDSPASDLSLKLVGQRITDIELSAHGDHLLASSVSGDNKPALHLWSWTSRQPRALPAPADSGLSRIAMSADGSLLFATGDKEIWSLDLRGNDTWRPRFIRYTAEINDIALSHDDALLASVDKDGLVQLWDVHGNNLDGCFSAGQPALSVSFATHARRLAFSTAATVTIMGDPAQARAHACGIANLTQAEVIKYKRNTPEQTRMEVCQPNHK